MCTRWIYISIMRPAAQKRVMHTLKAPMNHMCVQTIHKCITHNLLIHLLFRQFYACLAVLFSYGNTHTHNLWQLTQNSWIINDRFGQRPQSFYLSFSFSSFPLFSLLTMQNNLKSIVSLRPLFCFHRRLIYIFVAITAYIAE